MEADASEISPVEEALKFLSSRKAYDETQLEDLVILFVGVGGSQAYNLHTQNSDLDLVGVFLEPLDETLKLHVGRPRFTSYATLPADPKPDITLHEARYFCSLLEVGNPFVVEYLFMETPLFESESWKKLKQIRKSFPTRQAVRQYLSYIKDQFEKHQKKNLVGKRFYHILRLLFEVQRIIRGEDPLVFLPEGDERDYLMKIKLEHSTEAINSELELKVKELIDDIESKQPWENLPEKSPLEALHCWLVDMRSKQMLTPGWRG
eukprot:TRINITY_DN14483_c0_g1_i1.p1 TRINITY_DN14483_c0_g1~~TRINITY_DN14483_c0_g1_i1.p1  ORF type:complete len:263 (-),score=41.45 TRINITY_DN14483_c0_g1_i1:213-1001(-)